MLKVQDQSPEIVELSKNWGIVEALLGGTEAMRDAGKAYLPQQPAEQVEDYDYRLAVSTLFPAFERTLSVMGGKPFAKQITIGDDVPAKVKAWLDDVDLQGNNLHVFASDEFQKALSFGLCGLLVDFPRLGEEVKTLNDERAANARPYLVQVRHDQILGWKSEKGAGSVRLTQLRIAETVEVDDGRYGTVCVKRVRVLTPGNVEIWEEDKKDSSKYNLIEAYPVSLQRIPFVPFYGKKKGFMCGVSPLQNLANLNVEHWQESSDQKDSTRFARKRLLALIGAENIEGDVVVSSNFALRLNTGGDVKVVQGSAESVKVGRSEIAVLEEQMIQAGAELLIQKPGIRTATEANNDAEANKSDLQRIVESYEDSIDQALQLMAEWVGEKQGGHVSLFKDFGAATLTDASAALVLAMRNQGLITKKTAILEEQRRGMLSPDVDPDEELAAVELEGPALGDVVPPVNAFAGASATRQ